MLTREVSYYTVHCLFFNFVVKLNENQVFFSFFLHKRNMGMYLHISFAKFKYVSSRLNMFFFTICINVKSKTPINI